MNDQPLRVYPRMTPAEQLEAITQPMGELTPEMQADREAWNALLDAYRKLKATKPEDRNERARRYAVTITEFEKTLSYFHTMVIEDFEG